ncbi:BMP family lipoprotein [Bacillus sp. FJAT-45037]|uniref:BMP family lipoprotein n=1 Tax=Bacillus sp. FJAT-45037 TaxID=2011007 RepID=UPI000C240F2E|nr:BMP family ABC transporter substrate-binding protein [Bacillus sp. FJAT-45037]
MKALTNHFLITIFVFILFGCQNEATVQESEEQSGVRVGIVLSDVGLGDQSFSDSAFQGLIRARDELDITFDYRELETSGTYEQGLEELVSEDFDLIIGLGFMIKEALESTATSNPEQQFVLIDDVSDLNNVASVTFEEHEGSFLVGAVAALTTTSQKIGFVGGSDFPLINKFAAGFEQGAHYVNEEIEVFIDYADDFGSPEIGEELTATMINAGADVMYAAAGLTGVGVLQEAQREEVLSVGVDSDQYFLAEDSVMTSMMKYIDQAVYQTVQSYMDGELEPEVVLGLAENGVGLAPFRLVNEEDYLSEISAIEKAIIDGEIIVSEMRGTSE